MFNQQEALENEIRQLEQQKEKLGTREANIDTNYDNLVSNTRQSLDSIDDFSINKAKNKIVEVIREQQKKDLILQETKEEKIKVSEQILELKKRKNERKK